MRGKSGIIALSHPARKPIYNPSTKTAVYANGSQITTFTGEQPDGIAGSEAQLILIDELFLMPYQREVYDQLQFTLRLGGDDEQQVVIASTPRPSELAKELLQDSDDVTVVTGSSGENTALTKGYMKRLQKRYGNTRLGRQEMNAELLLDNPDSLFESESIEKNRVTKQFFKSIFHEVERIVIAVDPSTTNNKSSDLCGICVAAKVEDRAYVLEDLSIKELPERWAAIVADAYNRHGASACIAEVNQGGDMVELVLRQQDTNMNIQKIHTRIGKYTRAEPVSNLYSRNLISHVGVHEKLEEEMVTWSPKLGRNQKSPDRMDALVYAVSALLISNQKKAWVA